MEKQIYLFHGPDTFIIKSKTNQIITKLDVDEFNVTVYDAEETNVKNAVNDAQTIPFMSDKKVIIIKNCYFPCCCYLEEAAKGSLRCYSCSSWKYENRFD